MDLRSRRRLQAGVGALLALAAFGVMLYLAARPRLESGAAASLEQPMPRVSRESVELQVALHDLVERAHEGLAIRVCRSVASRPVRLDVASGESLEGALEGLARQAGTRLVVEGRGLGEAPLPTFSCPSGVGDWLVIGRAEAR